MSAVISVGFCCSQTSSTSVACLTLVLYMYQLFIAPRMLRKGANISPARAYFPLDIRVGYFALFPEETKEHI